ncbi:hypothetical protein BDZ89DRAFT_1073975 [Hymenopellis radicata]|nr:hypothetical protein BDZ89DRAFT_1073975 [Hymenopellis radicata]
MTGALREPLCPSCTPPPAQIGQTPRFEELLHHNLPPFESEIPEYESIFKEASVVLTDLDTRIEKVQTILDSLIRARIDTQKRADDAKAVLHPVRSIPSEILFEIFAHCVATWHNPDPGGRCWDSLHPGFPPWSLSQVCQRWRTAVLSSPELWSYLELQFQTHRGHISRLQCAAKVSLWLERCADFPISLRLVSRTKFKLRTHPVLPVLRGSMKTWARVKVRMPTRTIQCFSGNSLPLLRFLYVDKYVETKTDVQVDVFSSAPNLRTFESSTAEAGVLQHLLIPSVQLTSVVFHHDFHEWNVPHLRVMTNLTMLELTAHELYNEGEDGTIFLPELSRLCLFEGNTAETGALKALFGGLCVPNLDMLELRFPQAVDDHIMHFPVFHKPPEKLTYLFLQSNMAAHPSNTDSFLQFLSTIPFVTQLQICDLALTAKFMTQMMVLDGEAFSLLPCLRQFEMDDCWKHRDLPYETIWDMLESRCLSASAPAIAELTSRRMEGRCRVDTLFVPRWLYHRDDERWRNIRRSLEVFCGTTMKDTDDCIDYYCP